MEWHDDVDLKIQIISIFQKKYLHYRICKFIIFMNFANGIVNKTKYPSETLAGYNAKKQNLYEFRKQNPNKSEAVALLLVEEYFFS